MKNNWLYIKNYKKWINTKRVESFQDMGFKPSERTGFLIVMYSGDNFYVSEDEYLKIREIIGMPKPKCIGVGCRNYIWHSEKYSACMNCINHRYSDFDEKSEIEKNQLLKEYLKEDK